MAYGLIAVGLCYLCRLYVDCRAKKYQLLINLFRLKPPLNSTLQGKNKDNQERIYKGFKGNKCGVKTGNGKSRNVEGLSALSVYTPHSQ